MTGKQRERAPPPVISAPPERELERKLKRNPDDLDAKADVGSDEFDGRFRSAGRGAAGVEGRSGPVVRLSRITIPTVTQRHKNASALQ